ncbi:glutamate--tRNA ligase [Spiroplasma platyhelix]|nr:glutamate--tRNA ligase [Spiroplasma platyhelix]MBE4704255.1 Glutamate--tRNA ligase [Spiroplasma platyhelix PALS-1]UJB28839.1 glutamyl-tRNA synthetase [Spiroplasma platyhelix PALS-1]
MEIRVRYAPSPTGYLHIGGARTAVFNYLFAKHHNGKFIVRIEDTDLERNIADGISSQLDNLRWLGLEIDETIDHEGKYGPYQQTKRLDIYRSHADKLIADKHAYHCFCTNEALDKMKAEQQKVGIFSFQYDGRCAKLSPAEVKKNLADKVSFAIRLKTPKNKIFTINDMVREEVSFNTKDIGDFVIIKSNGVATYNFAVVIDDYLMKITHVLRGEEHLSNTPKQLLIYDYFNWQAPRYGHLTLIISETGKKLSKRDGSLMQFIEQYRNQGYLSEALFNFISLLGWSSHQEREIYTKSELIKIFNSDYFSKAPSMFDVRKLLWMNNYYIKNLTQEQYLNLVVPFVKSEHDWESKDEQWWQELLLIYQKQLMYGAEINELISLFFENKPPLTKEAQDFLQTNPDASKKVLDDFKAKLATTDDWSLQEIENIIQQVKADTKITGKMLFMTIRIACSRQTHGPELAKTIKLLGKEQVLTRLTDLKL